MILSEFQVTVGWNEFSGTLAVSGYWEASGIGGISAGANIMTYPVSAAVNSHLSGAPFTPYLNLSLDTTEHATEVLEALQASEATLRLFTDDTNYIELLFTDAEQFEGFSGLTETIRWTLTGDYEGLDGFWLTSVGQVRTVQVYIEDPPLKDRMRFSNFAYSTLAAAVAADDTDIELASRFNFFPTLGASEIFSVVVTEGSKYEIMYCTARAGGVLTVERGQEGTTAQSFSAGASVVHTATAAFFTSVAERPLPPEPEPELGPIAVITAGTITDGGGNVHTGYAQASFGSLGENDWLPGSPGHIETIVGDTPQFYVASFSLSALDDPPYIGVRVVELDEIYLFTERTSASFDEWRWDLQTPFEEGLTYTIELYSEE